MLYFTSIGICLLLMDKGILRLHYFSSFIQMTLMTRISGQLLHPE